MTLGICYNKTKSILHKNVMPLPARWAQGLDKQDQAEKAALCQDSVGFGNIHSISHLVIPSSTSHLVHSDIGQWKYNMIPALKSISMVLGNQESLLEGEDPKFSPEGKVGREHHEVKGAEKADWTQAQGVLRTPVHLNTKKELQESVDNK